MVAIDATMDDEKHALQFVKSRIILVEQKIMERKNSYDK